MTVVKTEEKVENGIAKNRLKKKEKKDPEFCVDFDEMLHMSNEYDEANWKIKSR